MKLGLAAIDAACERLARPERSFPAALIGGTNGKGSTAATLAAIASASGRRVGLYTSPHLISATERVRVGPDDARPEALDEALAEVFDAADRAPEIPLTYFEAITAAAFVLFRSESVDFGVLEVGLGGRLDATNVTPARISVVTSIALDHTAELGNDLPSIAREKAGIFRSSRPALVRAEDPGALAVLAAEADRMGAAFHDAAAELRVSGIRTGVDGTEFDLETPERRSRQRTPLPGAHQAWNAALAIRAAELLSGDVGAIPDAAISDGLAAVRWPGRLERLRGPAGRPILLDGCHNSEGARALARFLTESGLEGRSPLVFGAMADKDVEGIAAALFPRVARVVFVQAAPPRGATPEELVRRVGDLAPGSRSAPDVASALALLGGIETGPDAPPIIVAGSLYLVGEARATLLAG